MKNKQHQESGVPFTELYVEIDDYCLEHQHKWKQKALPGGYKRQRNRSSKMRLSEMMTIVVAFQLSGMRTFKDYYRMLQIHHRSEFKDLISYQRFVEWLPRLLMPLTCYLDSKRGECTGISFIDSTPLRVCKTKRISRNKVFNQIARTGKSSMGWFHGFKLHLVINDKGELIGFCLSPGNTDDRARAQQVTTRVWGKLFGDKGYIGKELFETLFEKGITLLTQARSNMKNKLMCMEDKILLRKRSLIETINDQLKNICQIEHSRHRSPSNFCVNLIAALCAYCHLPKKPSLKLNNQIAYH